MSETLKKSWIHDQEGNKVAVRTTTTAIQDDEGTLFQDYLDKMVMMPDDDSTEIPGDIVTYVTYGDLRNIVADEYDNTARYDAGDYCIHENILYKCITAIATAEEFDSAKWEVTSVKNEISELNSNLDTKQDSLFTAEINCSAISSQLSSAIAGWSFFCRDTSKLFIFW